jgi:Zn-dependent peptidase ImmA (M78 family)/DNA-binding XRE family transcriptional regulator
MSPFVPERLLLARRLRGYTKKYIAEELKVSEASLTHWESGRSVPQQETLRRLARVLDIPEGFLRLEGASIVDPEAVSFRSLRALTRSNRDRATAAATVAAQIASWINQAYRLPEPSLPDLSDAPADLAAAEMRRLWNLGHGPLPSTVSLLEYAGVRCFALGFELPQADALSTWIDETPLVLFNVMKSAERSRNDAAHELGHLVLHRHKAPAGDQAEREAIAFASELLLPADSVKQSAQRAASRAITLSELLQLKAYWGVSAAMMLKRLSQLEVVAEWAARGLWQQLAMNGYRSSEPFGRAREHSQVLDQVVRHLRSSGKRPFQHIAQQLQLSTADVRQRVEGLLAVEVLEGGAELGQGLAIEEGRRDLKLVP